MFFWQIKQHGDNFSYIVTDDSTGEAAVVDSSFNGDEITRIIKTEKLKLKYLINTHSHSDHTAGNEKLRLMFDVKTVSHKLSRGTPDKAPPGRRPAAPSHIAHSDVLPPSDLLPAGCCPTLYRRKSSERLQVEVSFPAGRRRQRARATRRRSRPDRRRSGRSPL